MIKTLYFDCETTGLDPRRCAITQFAGIMDIDGEVVDEINIFMRPFDGAQIEDDALITTGKSLEEVMAYPDARIGYNFILTFFGKHINKYNKNDKFFPSAYCGHFDIDFLSNFFKLYGDSYGLGSYCNWNLIDPLPILRRLKRKGYFQDIVNLKLKTTCEYFGIPLNNAHDALSDVKALRILDRKIDDVISFIK